MYYNTFGDLVEFFFGIDLDRFYDVSIPLEEFKSFWESLTPSERDYYRYAPLS